MPHCHGPQALWCKTWWSPATWTLTAKAASSASIPATGYTHEMKSFCKKTMFSLTMSKKLGCRPTWWATEPYQCACRYPFGIRLFPYKAGGGTWSPSETDQIFFTFMKDIFLTDSSSQMPACFSFSKLVSSKFCVLFPASAASLIMFISWLGLPYLSNFWGVVQFLFLFYAHTRIEVGWCTRNVLIRCAVGVS